MMSGGDLQEIVISKEEAVFWMDRFGRWHNDGGRFEHKKIIDYFNTSIRKDKDGYFVEQIRDNIREKVYFRYEDTPLFAVDVLISDPFELILNTGEKLLLRPDSLFVHKDNLYVRRDGEKIKFTDRVLLKLSEHLVYDKKKYYFLAGGTRIVLPGH